MGSENSAERQSTGRGLRWGVIFASLLGSLLAAYFLTSPPSETGDSRDPTGAPTATAGPISPPPSETIRRAQDWIPRLTLVVTERIAKPPLDPWNVWLTLRALGPKAPEAHRQALLKLTPEALAEAGPSWLHEASAVAIELARMEARLGPDPSLASRPLTHGSTIALAWDLEVQALASLRQVDPANSIAASEAQQELGRSLVKAERLLRRSLQDGSVSNPTGDAIPTLLLSLAVFRATPFVQDPELTSQVRRDFARLQQLPSFSAEESSTALTVKALRAEAYYSYSLSVQGEPLSSQVRLNPPAPQVLVELLNQLEQSVAGAPTQVPATKESDFALVSALRALRLAVAGT